MGQIRAEETLEEGAGTIAKFQVGHGTVCSNAAAAGDSEGLNLKLLGGVGASHGGEDVLGDLFDGVDENIDPDAPVALEEAERLQQQAKKIYDNAFSRLQDEPSSCGKELEKLTSELKDSKAFSARKGEDLSRLHVSLEGVRQERAGLAEQIGQKDALVRQLREEAATKDAEILKLKGQNEAVTLERDLLRAELASTQDLLRSAQKEAAALSMAKFEGKENASSYMKDSATANERARETYEKAEQKLTRAIVYAGSQARRQALEEASAKGTDLSSEIEEART
ncbi:PREDICTED: uncharacterized protein LOC109233222 [Nicotiana attenuata]|uniref:uncharacterized protein LOC109233222 n=1 Tax=Nicotiana attenuata TaxID=49451 RepID=UPI000904BFB3|nr:PREDICTED: uncharacterized protein LOC109233222 [Nicotiana attenuata]